jgi:hypothetical protein
MCVGSAGGKSKKQEVKRDISEGRRSIRSSGFAILNQKLASFNVRAENFQPRIFPWCQTFYKPSRKHGTLLVRKIKVKQAL